jgi:hypothetical protein
MSERLPVGRRIAWILLAALISSASAWSDARVHDGAATPDRVCYCDCEAKAGAPVCMHMCDLAKYENRPWAASCHKKSDSETSEPTAPSVPRSSKNNDVQQARR